MQLVPSFCGDVTGTRSGDDGTDVRQLHHDLDGVGDGSSTDDHGDDTGGGRGGGEALFVVPSAVQCGAVVAGCDGVGGVPIVRGRSGRGRDARPG